jgi:hypothetical protein
MSSLTARERGSRRFRFRFASGKTVLVHTSPATLRAGERRLEEIQRRLEREGRL